MAKKVFLGVGHGGKDPGAVANGLKEKDVNLSIALACERVLTKNGVLVAMSRTVDEDDPLTDEIKECNKFEPDLAVEIHNNSGEGNGIEVYHYHKGGTSKTLAENILNEVVSIGQNSRGLKTKLNEQGNDYFGWIRQTVAPAVLVECAFLDSADHEIINTPQKQEKMGSAIAMGILKTLGITVLTNEKPESEEHVLYKVQAGAFKDKNNAINMQKKLKDAGFESITIKDN